MADRADNLLHANGPLIEDRCEFLSARVRGKDVLDIGCVNHSASSADDSSWLHARLAAQARSCIGADILAEEIDLLRSKGYHVVQLDVTKDWLPQEFDVIVCGEVIEHVGHPEALFINCRKMMRDGGRLFLSTPNPWYINYVLKSVFSRNPVVDSVEHVAWYDPSVLAELASRAGFRLVHFQGIKVTKTNTLKARLFFATLPLWRALGVRKETFAKSILYEFAPSVKVSPAAQAPDS